VVGQLTVEYQSLVSLGNAKLEGKTSVLDTGPARSASATVVATDENVVGLGLGNTRSNDTNTNLTRTSCVACPPNAWCIAGARNECPVNSVSAALSVAQNQCLCAPGYFGNGSRTGTSPCPLCPANSYCPGGNAELVVACPANFVSSAGASASGCSVRSSSTRGLICRDASARRST
jgi:hypothetical protein